MTMTMDNKKRKSLHFLTSVAIFNEFKIGSNLIYNCCCYRSEQLFSDFFTHPIIIKFFIQGL